MIEAIRKPKRVRITFDAQERRSIELSTFYAYEELLSRSNVLEEDIPVLLLGEEGRITQASDTDLTRKYVDYDDALKGLRDKENAGNPGGMIPFEVQEEVVMQPGQRVPVNSPR